MLMNKHLKLDQAKIEKAKRILDAKTETETINRALQRVIEENTGKSQKRKIMRQMLRLRGHLGKMPEVASGWVRQSRQERISSYDRGA